MLGQAEFEDGILQSEFSGHSSEMALPCGAEELIKN